MRKHLGFGLLLCVILIATLSGNYNSNVFAATKDVQAIKNGKVVYYKDVNSLLYDELNEGFFAISTPTLNSLLVVYCACLLTFLGSVVKVFNLSVFGCMWIFTLDWK